MRDTKNETGEQKVLRDTEKRGAEEKLFTHGETEGHMEDTLEIVSSEKSTTVERKCVECGACAYREDTKRDKGCVNVWKPIYDYIKEER